LDGCVGLAAAVGGGALGRLVPADGEKALGLFSLSAEGVFCGVLAAGAADPGLATGVDQRSFGFAAAVGGGVLGLCAAFCGGVVGCRVLAAGDGDPGLATGVDQRSFGFAAAVGGGVLGLCATFGAGVFRCGALAAGDGVPGLTTGADQGVLGFALALAGGALGRLFVGGGESVPGRCATFGVAVTPGEETA